MSYKFIKSNNCYDLEGNYAPDSILDHTIIKKLEYWYAKGYRLEKSIDGENLADCILIFTDEPDYLKFIWEYIEGGNIIT